MLTNQPAIMIPSLLSSGLLFLCTSSFIYCIPSIWLVVDLSAPVLITFNTLNPFLSCSSICRQTVLDTVQICSFWSLTCVITNSYLFSGFCASKNLGFSTGFILCLSRSTPITYVVPGFGLKYWLDVTTSSSISSMFDCAC
jgi:hypothetical protein